VQWDDGFANPQPWERGRWEWSGWPNGTWNRIYILADGSVQTVSSETGDFSEFERKHTARRDP